MVAGLAYVVMLLSRVIRQMTTIICVLMRSKALVQTLGGFGSVRKPGLLMKWPLAALLASTCSRRWSWWWSQRMPQTAKQVALKMSRLRSELPSPWPRIIYSIPRCFLGAVVMHPAYPQHGVQDALSLLRHCSFVTLLLDDADEDQPIQYPPPPLLEGPGPSPLPPVLAVCYFTILQILRGRHALWCSCS